MSRKVISLSVIAVAISAFSFAYAITAWANGGGCCGFCNLP